MLLTNLIAFDGARFCSGLRVRLAEGRVAETGEALSPRPGERTEDLGGDWLLPGFVDVHIHAFQGHDTMRGEADIRAMSRGLRAQGVAAFCPTTMSAPPEETAAALEGVRRVMNCPEPEGARVLGAHMEAPFLSEAHAGAQRAACFRDPSWDAFLALCGGRPETIRLITLAPERPGSEAFVRQARCAGIHVSIGHSGADAETVHAAADWGADHVTHLFNAQTPLRHRAPGIPGAALTDDRLWCELICDGIHLHPDTVRLAVRAKADPAAPGGGRALAITDAMEAAGLSDGVYALGGQRVTVAGGAARLDDGTLAGSVLTMPGALRSLLHFGIEPETACAMCTSVPAASVGETRLGRLEPGSPAIFTRWDRGWERMRPVIG